MSNESAFAALEAQIHRLKSVKASVPDLARKVAEKFREVTLRNVQAGLAPDGTSWKLRLDGQRALQTAANSLTFTSIDNVIVVRVRGHVGLHHLGRGRGRILRQVIPTDEIPQPAVDAIKEVVIEELQGVISGR
jgi:phage gpG-like protein